MSVIIRLINILKSNSFFLFGARGTGKSTLLRDQFLSQNALWIDLLDPVIEDRYARDPILLRTQIQKEKPLWVVIDEVQKQPRLLELVHQLIETTATKFALTGSSARKLKSGQANLLAGRAFVNHLYPLTHHELVKKFDLQDALEWGGLPKVLAWKTPLEKSEFLKSYALTYLKEEVWAEHVIRQLEPFRKFLEIAAQNNGEIINYRNIARDVGVDPNTIHSYYQILEDTLVGFHLPAYHRSLRKQQRQSAKFYLFDTGVKRALDGTLSQTLSPNTYGYGKAFEHFLILEIFRLNTYLRKDFRFYYFRTQNQLEIDLIIERPGMPVALVEIKSSTRVDERDIKVLNLYKKDFKHADCYVLSNDEINHQIDSIHCLHWQNGIKELGLG